MVSLPIRLERQRSPQVERLLLEEPDKTERLTQLFRMDPNELQKFSALLDLQNISLTLNRHGDGYLVLFENPSTGDIYQIDAGLYAQALKPLVGFSVRGENEGYQEFLEREKSAFSELSHFDAEKDSALPPFTYVHFKAIVDWASGETLRESFGLNEREWEHLAAALKFYNLKPILIPHKGAYICAFVDQEDIYRQLPEPFNDVGGFVFERDDFGGAREVTPELLEEISQEYQQVIGMSQDLADQLGMVLPKLYQYPRKDWLTGEFLGMYFDELDGKKTPQEHLTPSEEHEENAETRQRLIEYLSPFLEEEGLQLIDARELMQPGYAEAMSQGIYKNMYRYPLVDYLIVQKDTPVTELGYVNILGWQKPHNGDAQKPPSDLIVYSNVCGLMVISPDMPVAERKKLTRYAGQQIRRFFPSSRAKPVVTTIDLPLIEQGWGQVDTPLVDDIEEAAANPFDSASQAAKKILSSANKGPDYGAYPGFHIHVVEEPTIELVRYTPRGEHIGAAPTELRIRRSKDLISAIPLDFGLDFGYAPSWTGLGSFPPATLGLNPWVGEGKMFPRKRRFYRLDLLEKSINEHSLRQVAAFMDKPVDHPDFFSDTEFFLLEIFHRLGEAQFTQFLREKSPRETQDLMRKGQFVKFLNFCKEREKKFYTLKIIYDLLALSHNHQDHTVGVGLMREDIIVGMSVDTRAQAHADFDKASNWLQKDVAAVRMLNLPKVGNAYQVVERPYLLFEDGQRYEVSPGIFVTGYDVYHSILGAMGFVVDVVFNGKHLVQFGYPGDYRDPGFFIKYGAHKLTPAEIKGTISKAKRRK